MGLALPHKDCFKQNSDFFAVSASWRLRACTVVASFKLGTRVGLWIPTLAESTILPKFKVPAPCTLLTLWSMYGRSIAVEVSYKTQNNLLPMLRSLTHFTLLNGPGAQARQKLHQSFVSNPSKPPFSQFLACFDMIKKNSASLRRNEDLAVLGSASDALCPQQREAQS